MAGKIEKLRIGYSATLEIPAPEEEEEAQDITPGQSLHKDPLESLNSISHLRYPGSKDEKDAEGQENVDLWRALREQRSHKFPSFKALLTDQKRRRQRLNFVVKREDDPIGDVGTVLVLTRPTAS